MANTSLLQVRVDAADREKASEILESLGTNLSAAVNMMIKQIIITEGIPFEVRKVNSTTPHKKQINTGVDPENLIVIPAVPARVIPAIEYTNVISRIPEGKVARYDDINRYFAEKYHAERAEPDYSGWPWYDNEGKEIPYWRIVGTRGTVSGSHRYKAAEQYERLLSEGVELVPYKKSYRIVDYKKYLFDVSKIQKGKIVDDGIGRK